MRRNFLRRPRGIGEWAADALRVVGLVSVLIAAVVFEPTDAGILAFSLPALLVPRFVGVRSGFDVVYGVVVLTAAWSNVLDLYTRISWWDLVVHFACTGVLAVILYLALSRARVVPDLRGISVPRRAPLVLTAAIGLAISALWEMVEWAGWRFISDEIYVAYQDSIGDMAIGGLGALVGGVMLARIRLDREDALPRP
ncbi:hypothetical protein [Microbacterium sp. cx-59]|uniref:hypothetical protein n=1 Tax=Microbacterium sp. cx-59 TaxID=2891207 RepID=UPI001E2FDAE6|nr:hypothetical protein [Microbacterium sp. cx-59]MCC4907536.1 hypothetical protein [Microbacterium sp. cx-59]